MAEELFAPELTKILEAYPQVDFNPQNLLRVLENLKDFLWSMQKTIPQDGGDHSDPQMIDTFLNNMYEFQILPDDVKVRMQELSTGLAEEYKKNPYQAEKILESMIHSLNTQMSDIVQK